MKKQEKIKMGRKQAEDPKKLVGFYMHQSAIDAIGGMDAIRREASRHCTQLAKDMAAIAKVMEKYGGTHTMRKMMGTEPDLTTLDPNQTVAWGDGETFYWLLTKKDQ